LVAIVLCGCGSSSSVSPDEGEAISLVLDVSDATRSEEEFTALFATGRTPAKGERQKYANFSFAPVGIPSIAGEEASFTVAVADADDNKIGETSWSAVKEQGKWKLSSAPLP
jgi:hypothetical protein